VWLTRISDIYIERNKKKYVLINSIYTSEIPSVGYVDINEYILSITWGGNNSRSW
jgi:hypothetical protein